MARLHSTMTRNYAAALLDDSQQAMNIWLKADVQQLECIGKTLKLNPIPRQLQRAAELLGEGHYMYRSLQARRLLFEGIVKMKHENPDEALGRKCLSLFQQSLALEAQSPLPWHRMSQVYAKNLRMPDSAFTCARKARELAPNWILPLVDLGYRFTHQRKFEFAKQALMEAEAIAPQHPYVINRWAFWYNQQTGRTNWEKAFSLFEKYRNSGGPMYPCWHNDFSLLLSNLGKYSESETELLKAIALDSTNANAWNSLGFLYTETQRYLESEPYFRKAISLDSTYVNAYNNLAHVHTETGRYEEAEMLLKKLFP